MDMNRITDQRLTELIAMATQDPLRGSAWHDDTDSALLELQSRRKNDAITADLLTALKDVRKRIENSDSWWMDCPDKGGFDTDVIDVAIQKAEEAGL